MGSILKTKERRKEEEKKKRACFSILSQFPLLPTSRSFVIIQLERQKKDLFM